MTVLGLPAITANLARIREEIESDLPHALEEGAEIIRDAWVANIEAEGLVLTGAYRDSVHIERDVEGLAVLSDVPYAPILEYGDSRQAAHPVAERALDEHHDEALDRVGSHVSERLK